MSNPNLDSRYVKPADVTAAISAQAAADAGQYAPKASPALTGLPTVPTAASGTNTQQAASTAFVTSAVKATGVRTPYLGPVGSRSAVANVALSTSTVKQSMTWEPQRAADDITQVALLYSSFAGTAESTATASGTITASVEYPAGTITQITFTGVASGTIAAASTLQSDLVTLTTKIPAGARFWIGTWVNWSSSALAPRPQNMVQTTMRTALRASVNQSSTSVVDTTITGVRTDTGYNGQTDNYGPVAVLGMTTRPTFFLAGDSETNAQNLYSITDSDGLKGLGESIVGLRYGYINAAINSDSYALANVAYTNRLALSAYCTHVLDLYGVNDAYVNTLANEVSAFTTFRNKFSATKPYFKTTVVPKVTGAWNLADGSDQTPVSGYANMLQFNDMIRNGLNGLIDGYIDLDDLTSLGRGSARIKPAEVVITDAAMTSGSNILTSATHNFIGDLNKYVGVVGAGASGALLIARITGITDAHTVTLGLQGTFSDNVTNASTTVSSATCGIGITSLDGTHQLPRRERDIRGSLLAITPLNSVR